MIKHKRIKTQKKPNILPKVEVRVGRRLWKRILISRPVSLYVGIAWALRIVATKPKTLMMVQTAFTAFEFCAKDVDREGSTIMTVQRLIAHISATFMMIELR